MDITHNFSQIRFVVGSKVSRVFVHHTAVTLTRNPDQWNATNNYHKSIGFHTSSMGWNVGYNFEISADGTIRQARPIGETTCAQIGFNNEISIALDGFFDEEMPTEAQVTALQSLLQYFVKTLGVLPESIEPHRFVATNHIAKGSVCVSNTSQYKTIDNCMPYKSCYGSKLSDSWARSLVEIPADELVSMQIPKSKFDRVLAFLKTLA